MVSGLGIPVVGFHQAISKHPDPLSLYPFCVNGHFNAEGYAMLAKQIAKRLDGVGRTQ